MRVADYEHATTAARLASRALSLQAVQTKAHPSHALDFVMLNRVALDRPDLFPAAHDAVHRPRRRRASQSARRRSVCTHPAPALRPASAPCKAHGAAAAASCQASAAGGASDVENGDELGTGEAGAQAASVIAKLFSQEGQEAAAERRKVLARLRVRPGSGGSPCKSCAPRLYPVCLACHENCAGTCADTCFGMYVRVPLLALTCADRGGGKSGRLCRAKFAHALQARACEHEARCASARSRKAELEAQARAARKQLARRGELRTEHAAAMQLARQRRAEVIAEARPWRGLIEFAVRLQAIKVRPCAAQSQYACCATFCPEGAAHHASTLRGAAQSTFVRCRTRCCCSER